MNRLAVISVTEHNVLMLQTEDIADQTAIAVDGCSLTYMQFDNKQTTIWDSCIYLLSVHNYNYTQTVSYAIRKLKKPMVSADTFPSTLQ